jgi:predicted nucleic acid-binding protein
MILFVDTNVLVYASNSESPLSETALQKLTAARTEFQLACSSQVLREYIATMKRVGTISQDDILLNVRALMEQMIIYHETAETLALLLQLVEEFSPSAKNIHDTNIVATMLANEVKTILTHNVRDFEIFAHATKQSPGQSLVRSTERIEIIPLVSGE